MDGGSKRFRFDRNADVVALAYGIMCAEAHEPKRGDVKEKLRGTFNVFYVSHAATFKL